MFFKLKNYLFALTFGLLMACTARYHVVKSTYKEYLINNKLAVDSNIIITYQPYKIQLDAEMNRVIGYTAVDLTRNTDLPESVLGNFFADAVAAQAKKIVPNVDLVFPTTKGGLRNDIAKGEITVTDIFELMPFENQLVLCELKGSDVYTLLQYIAATHGQPVAGLKMKIVNKLPENIFISNKAFDAKKTYLVLTSDYIANGGDNAKGFANPISRKNIGLLVRDALLNETKVIQAAGKQIHAKLDGRITTD